ncbi:Component of the BRCA1-A complex [Entomophthora muscae]|uniref:Component of the BRCA1-A complex n=1 Tax=Entomophthora muscae TaxID=34485 RepID=A0ACC2UBD2_9FUNG|nr:Component of the BRCA1-A complex [Entomophthora muscae]
MTHRTWIDAVKRFTLELVSAKQKIQEKHRFGIWLLSETVVKTLDLTRDFARIKEAINSLACDTIQHGGFDFDHLRNSIASESGKASPGPTRIIFIYGRQGIPTKTFNEYLGGSSEVYFDAIFLHSPAFNSVNSQIIYDTIVSLDNPAFPGYFFEESINFPRLLNAVISLLAHPYYRTKQSVLNYTITL